MSPMEREKFSSRLGFILISAGCAIGLGNVWRFPYIVGKYGGAAFVLIYLLFLVVLGLPIVVMEFSVGRASRKSAALSFDVLEPKGSKWHLGKGIAIAGNYILMKSGKKMNQVKEILAKSGRDVLMVENCGMPEEHIYHGVEEIPDDAGYYSLIIAKEHK